VELSSNERTEFRARELKSVHVDAEGTFLKLVLHKNFVNKLNQFNQVGIVAINIIGNDLDDDVKSKSQSLLKYKLIKYYKSAFFFC
jgi:centrosomal protein CEP104